MSHCKDCGNAFGECECADRETAPPMLPVYSELRYVPDPPKSAGQAAFEAYYKALGYGNAWTDVMPIEVEEAWHDAAKAAIAHHTAKCPGNGEGCLADRRG